MLRLAREYFRALAEKNGIRYQNLINLYWRIARPGLVIVLDNADQVFAQHRRVMTELMEAFLVQVHHWLELKAPCRLCFRMTPHPLVAKLFGARNGESLGP